MSDCLNGSNGKICLLEGKSIVDNLNNISYYIGKIAVERNCKNKTRLESLNIKDEKGNEIYKIVYNDEPGNGLIGNIKSESIKMLNDFKYFGKVINPNPSTTCVKDPNDQSRKYVYSDDYDNYSGNNLNECFKNRIKNNNIKYEKYKKNIYKLYLLGFGSLMVYLV